jgi:TolB-like protein
MRPVPSAFLLLLIAGVACAPGVRPAGAPPADLLALEAQRGRHENDPDELTAIGISFYEAGAFERSRDVLLAVLALDPRAFRAALQLGLSDEALGEYDAALAAYRRAGAMKLSKSERLTVEARLLALTRLRLAAEARQAVAAEQSLAATPPVPNTIAVLPWTYLGSNPELRPLERGMAHLVISDLAKVSRLTLLERERVQALTDELALNAAGRTEPATAARSGRLLRAAEVVQGSIRETGPQSIRLDANVVSATTAAIRASGTSSDRLSQLFSMEKTLVLDLLGRLGIALNPAEQRAIAERPTADLQAFLAFRQGLEAEDRGNFAAAAQLFQRAVVRDPSFRAAKERSAQNLRIGQARMNHPPAAVRMRSAQLAAAIQAIAPTMAGRLGQRPGRLAALRARLAEALRQDDPSRLGAIGKSLSTIPRP